MLFHLHSNLRNNSHYCIVEMRMLSRGSNSKSEPTFLLVSLCSLQHPTMKAITTSLKLGISSQKEGTVRKMLQWEGSKKMSPGRLSTEENLVLGFGKNVNRICCQDFSYPKFTLRFHAWHMNFNNMTSMRKKKSSPFAFILLTEGSSGRQQDD